MKQFDAAEVNEKLSMADCIRAMETMFAREKDEIYLQPPRLLTMIDPDSLIVCMPAYSKILKRYAVKIVSEFKMNPKQYSLPVQGGLIVFIDALNSRVLGLFDCQAITEIRTAAVSGLATKLLSRKDSESLGIIGSGAEARRMLEAVLNVRPGIRSAKVFSLHYANAKKFADEAKEKFGISVEAVSERKLAIANADILIVATNAKAPVTSWSEVQEGCHINSIGTFQTELDEATVVNSKLFVDTKTGVLGEAKDVTEAIGAGKISESHIRADLAELVTGSKEGRASESEVTLFKSVGFGLQDVYACSHVVDRELASAAD